MSAEWLKLDTKDKETLLAAVNPYITPVPFKVENTTVRKRALPFYKDFAFYELSDMSTVPGARKYALSNGKSVYMVNWTNAPIYEVNEIAPITLDEQSVVDYVKFFFAYVRGRHGRFVIVENLDEIKWQNEPPRQGRKMIKEMLRPVTYLNTDKNGNYKLEAFMVFKDALFHTLIHVAPDGEVTMSDEEIKIEGMPVIQDAMIA